MPDPASDTRLLVEAAEAAGVIAMRHFRSDVEQWDKDDGMGPVTAADLEIDAMLASRLRAARPGYGWLSEESTDGAARLSADRVFIVDPIDGTRSFIAGEPGFSVALAVVEHGRPIAAAVHLPARQETFAATLGQGAVKNGRPVAVSTRTAMDGATVLTSKWQMRDENWPHGVPPLRREFRSSLAWRMCLVAEARFDTMLSFRKSFEWDIAAGALIAAEAGAAVTDGAGLALAFNSAAALTDGVIAAPPALHRAIMAHRLGPPAQD